MLFNKLKQTKERINKTKENISNNIDVIDIDVDSIILQLYSPIEDEKDIEYIKNTYIDRHKYESFSIYKICLELNFIIPILQVYYKEFGINRMSFILINNKYLSLLKDYKESNSNQQRMVVCIFMKALLEFIKDHIIFKNVNYMFELRNNLHMTCDEKFAFRKYFINSSILSTLSMEKKVLLNIISRYTFYSLESLEYIIDNNISVNMYDACANLLDTYLNKYIDTYKKIDIENYLCSSVNNMVRLSILFNDKHFMSKIKIYKPYFKEYKKIVAKTNFDNSESFKKLLDYNYQYMITNTFVLNEINDITRPSAKDIKILKFIETF